MKKENSPKKNYVGLFLKIAIVSFVVMFVFMIIGAITDVETGSSAFEAIRVFVLGFMYSTQLFSLLFVICVIYRQFKDGRILWAVITIILFGLAISEDWGAIPVLISCLWYYFAHIKPEFNERERR